MELKIKNFNCIKDITINLEPGFTILQGPSNSGKSSILKAIENTIFNQSGTSNVRQGQPYYLVEINHNNHNIQFAKGKGSKYKIDDQVYEKFGVNQLPEIADILNIRETILGGEKVRLNFSKQMSYPFLLDKTPGQLYKFIVDSSESENLSNVLKDINKDMKDLDKSIIQNEAQMDLLIKQQTDLNVKLSNSDRLLDITGQILALDSTDTSLNQLDMLKDRYNNIITNRDRLNILYNKYNININLNDLDSLRDSYNTLLGLYTKYTNIYNKKANLASYLNKVTLDINLDDIDKLEKDYTDLESLVKTYRNYLEKKYLLNTNINNLDKDINSCKEQLAKFKICPLCGSEIKC